MLFWRIMSWAPVVLYVLAGYVFIVGAFGLDLPPREPHVLQVGLAIAWVQIAGYMLDLRARDRRITSLRDTLDRERRRP